MPSQDPFPERADVPGPAGEPSDTSGQYRDLCSNCEHAAEHAGRGRPRRPIFFCEEFEVLGAVQVPEPDRAEAEPPVDTPRADRPLGLCANCDLVDSCRLPRPEGGVWHCEEYR